MGSKRVQLLFRNVTRTPSTIILSYDFNFVVQWKHISSKRALKWKNCDFGPGILIRDIIIQFLEFL